MVRLGALPSAPPSFTPVTAMKSLWVMIGFAFAMGLVCIVPHVRDWADPVAWLSAGLYGANLLCFWAVWGGKPTPWRWAGIIVFFVVIIRMTQGEYWSFVPSFFCQALYQVLISSLPCWTARFVGIQVAVNLPDNVPAGVASDAPRYQFSLAALLGWVTAVAVVMAALKCIPAASFVEPGVLPWPATCTLLGLPAIWVALGRRWLAIRCLAVLLMTLAVVTTLVMRFDPFMAQSVTATCLLATIWFLATLLFLRKDGYRLIWRGRVRL